MRSTLSGRSPRYRRGRREPMCPSVPASTGDKALLVSNQRRSLAGDSAESFSQSAARRPRGSAAEARVTAMPPRMTPVARRLVLAADEHVRDGGVTPPANRTGQREGIARPLVQLLDRYSER